MNYPDNILSKIQNPAQYTGNEYNIIKKNSNGKIRMIFSFPDLYSIGMSSYGHNLLYQMFNQYFDVYAERVYAVEKDMESAIREGHIHLRSLETGMDVRESDFIGFTLESEMTYTNVLQILELSGIHILSEEREEDEPIVCAGGTAVYNPLPMNAFIDVFFIGEAEKMADDIVNILRKKKTDNLSRNETIQLFDELPYTYVHLNTGSEKDVYQVTADKIDSFKYFKRPLVPSSKVVHDRVVIELSRGCTRGCRFCQAGYIYRPVRETKSEDIVSSAVTQIAATGYKEVSLLSLSATDYTCINELLRSLTEALNGEQASVSLPSLRVGTVDEAIYEQLSQVRKAGITIALETASERMKAIINKNISEEEVIRTVESGLTFGWKHFKLYFMIGLPFETDEDVVAIADIVNRISQQFKKVRFNVSVSPFVPRPFTPFQWVEQASMETIARREKIISENIRSRNVDLSYREPEISLLEGVFARGDDDLCRLILKAYNKGARLDQWSEHFDFKLWMKAAEEENIDFDKYREAYKPDEQLPWDFIKTKVSRSYLEMEYFAAQNRSYTEDCRDSVCTQCSACNGEIAGEKKQLKAHEKEESGFKRRKRIKIIASQERRIKLFMAYTVSEDFKYISHLAMINLLSAGMRRSGIDFLYTQGFNPKIKAVYGPPKPVGVFSDMEIMEAFVLSKPNADIINDINRAMPDGIRFTHIREMVSDKMSVMKQLNRLSMIVETEITESIRENIKTFIDSKSFITKRLKNDRIEEVDIRPFVERIDIFDSYIRIILLYNIQGGVKFEELIRDVLNIGEQEKRIRREKFYKIENNIEHSIEEL